MPLPARNWGGHVWASCRMRRPGGGETPLRTLNSGSTTMIIDTHVHVWALDEQHQPAPNAKVSAPTEADPVEWLIPDMEEHGVDRCVLVQSSAFGWDNTYMVECLERYPGRFKAIGL